MTTPTPYTVSEADAIAAAAKFTGTAAWTVARPDTGPHGYVLTGGGWLLVVDGEKADVVLAATLAPDLVS